MNRNVSEEISISSEYINFGFYLLGGLKMLLVFKKGWTCMYAHLASYFCSPRLRCSYREGSNPSDATYGLKVQQHKNAPWKAEVVHHGPAFNIRGSPDRQQWLSPGASSSSCYTKSAESNLCSLNHMFLILLSQKVSPHEYQYILISWKTITVQPKINTQTKK